MPKERRFSITRGGKEVEGVARYGWASLIITANLVMLPVWVMWFLIVAIAALIQSTIRDRAEQAAYDRLHPDSPRCRRLRNRWPYRWLARHRRLRRRFLRNRPEWAAPAERWRIEDDEARRARDL